MNTIPKDPGRDDMNFYVVHIICDDCSILPSKENQILFWVNCDHYAFIIKIWVTKSNINPSKQDLRGDRMLHCPIISTIVSRIQIENLESLRPSTVHTHKWPWAWCMECWRPLGLSIFLHVFPFISTTSIIEYPLECPIMCRQPLRNTLGCL